MDIRHLRYFLAIAELGSITRAAAQLNVAQPALSLHVKNMEAELGTQLLLRSKSGVTPLQRLNYVHVIDHRTHRPIRVTDCPVAD